MVIFVIQYIVTHLNSLGNYYNDQYYAIEV
jgi:hypothetical protein